MMFADGVVLCRDRKEELKADLEDWRQALESKEMKVSWSKTEYLCLNGTQHDCIKLGTDLIPQRKECKYLGSTLSANGESKNTEIRKNLGVMSVSERLGEVLSRWCGGEEKEVIS